MKSERKRNHLKNKLIILITKKQKPAKHFLLDRFSKFEQL